ncbi:MAG: hypothetical protein HUJ24_11175 [Rhodobacteraceae bacterium]|nr:hypothetical protein [Paracoccaceae bacterium]
MKRSSLFIKPHWRFFDHVPELTTLPLVVVACMDSFLEHVTARGLVEPQADDISVWALAEVDPKIAVEHLASALRVCMPSLIPAAQCAAQKLQDRQGIRTTPVSQHPHTEPPARGHRRPGPECWNPLSRPPSRYAGRRMVSVYPDELPAEWQEGLLRASHGLPGGGVFISPAILKRTREKLCQLAWSCKEADLPVTITERSVDRFQKDVCERSQRGKNGLRWATVRASIEELHRFARYLELDPALIKFLSGRRAVLESRERCQKALKHFELARTGNTTNSLLDMADGLLEGLSAVESPVKRHRMRNAACILGIYPIAPLRNASAYLVLGENLLWVHDEWVIDMMIRKTRTHNTRHLSIPLGPDHGKFIDAVLLGDAPVSELGERRARAIAARRPLFELPNGTPAALSYAPTIFKTLTENSFTTMRTMLHTDEAIEHGEAGTDYAMISSHQVGREIKRKYQLDTVAKTAVRRRQSARKTRRAHHVASAGK